VCIRFFSLNIFGFRQVVISTEPRRRLSWLLRKGTADLVFEFLLPSEEMRSLVVMQSPALNTCVF
jgi:hypothetical protein